MTERKVTLTREVAVIPIDEYLQYTVIVQDMRNFLERTETVGDELFRECIFRECVYLLTRKFPDYLWGNDND